MNPVITFVAPLVGLAVVGASCLAIPLPPDKTAAEYAELAIIYMKLNDTRADALFERALALDPGNVRTHYGAGVAALEAKRYDVAEREFETVLKAAPDHIDAVYALAAVYEKTRRNDRVEGLLKRMIAIEPQDSRPYQDLAQLAILRSDWRTARDYLVTYLDLIPKQAKKARKQAEAKVAKLNEKLGDKPAASPSPATPLKQKTK